MKEKTICVFCGREEEQGILSGGHFVSCGGTYQPACKECEKKLRSANPLKKVRLALDSDRAVAREQLQAALERLEAEEAKTYSGLSCLRCGGPMKYGKRTALQLAEMGTGDLSHLSSGMLKVSVQYCAHCGRLEFFQSDFHREEGESDEGRDQQ